MQDFGRSDMFHWPICEKNPTHLKAMGGGAGKHKYEAKASKWTDLPGKL